MAPQKLLFADDSNAFVRETSADKLKRTITNVLTEIFDWCNANKLTVNLNKTCYTIFKKKKKKNTRNPLMTEVILQIPLARIVLETDSLHLNPSQT